MIEKIIALAILILTAINGYQQIQVKKLEIKKLKLELKKLKGGVDPLPLSTLYHTNYVKSIDECRACHFNRCMCHAYDED